MVEVLKGEPAFRAIEARMAALKVVPDRRPTYDLADVSVGLLKLIEVVKGYLDAQGAREGEEGLEEEPLYGSIFNEATVSRLREVVAGLPVVVAGAVYAESRDDRQVDEALGFEELLEQAEVLRVKGAQAVRALSGIGLVGEDKAGGLLRKRGRKALGGDLIEVGALGKAHWGVLEPLQPLQPRVELRVEEGDFVAMDSIGSSILLNDPAARDAGSAQEWRQKYIRAVALVEGDWNFARKFTALALMNAGRPSAHLPSIFALSRA